MRESVRIGCYGLNGHQIHGHIGDLRRAELTAFGGIPRERWEALCREQPERFAGAAYFEDYDTFLTRADVDLVSLCSPRRDEQAAHAAAALRAGKHVLAEKPMATTRPQWEDLRAAAETSGRHLWTMTSMIYDPAIQGMKEVVRDGRIGDIVQVYAMKSYPYHDRRPQDRGLDGGLIMQAGIHAVSFIAHVAGLGFGEVFAQDTGTGNPGQGALQMAANLACRMDHGALATIVCNYCNPPGFGSWGNDQLRIHGTRGMVELVDGFSRGTLSLGEEPPTSFPDRTPPASYPQDLVDAILDGAPTLLTQEQAFADTLTVLRAQESADTGEPLPVGLAMSRQIPLKGDS